MAGFSLKTAITGLIALVAFAGMVDLASGDLLKIQQIKACECFYILYIYIVTIAVAVTIHGWQSTWEILNNTAAGTLGTECASKVWLKEPQTVDQTFV